MVEPDFPDLSQSFANLLGIPSYHYQPVFAQAAARALDDFQPGVVALECPQSVAPELEWASQCWPGPVVSVTEGWFFPFIPGDSIFETYRRARSRGIEIALVDLDHDVHPSNFPGRGSELPDQAQSAGPEESNSRPGISIPGPELADAGGRLFLETVEGLIYAAGPATSIDMAREAHMAQQLSHLMEKHGRVMWVGGAAHWRNVIDRIERSDFAGPTVNAARQRDFRRFRLLPSSMEFMTKRIPRLVAAFAQDPERYSEDAAIRALALDALKSNQGAGYVAIISLPGANDAAGDAINQDREEGTPLDVARLLLYARNLALTDGLRHRPSLFELLSSAVGTVGSRYAGRLYMLAMEEHVSAESTKYDPMSWDVSDEGTGFKVGGEWLGGKPWWPTDVVTGNGLILRIQVVPPEQKWVPYPDVGPGDDKSQRYWGAYPSDESEYERFVEYVLRRASAIDPGEAKSLPFLAGLRDGLDARATIQHWQDGAIYVREDQRGKMKFTNGAIDWSNSSEYAPILQGREKSGWADPDCLKVGTVSWISGSEHEDIQDDPYPMHISHRNFSMITLDAPTWIEGNTGDRQTFTDLVGEPLLDLHGVGLLRTERDEANDNIYGWLEVMFKFCAGKPFAYYSQYVPSLRIFSIAAKHRVKLMHLPLRTIPRGLLRRHQAYRFMEMTLAQWRELIRQMAEQGLWEMVATLQSHANDTAKPERLPNQRTRPLK